MPAVPEFLLGELIHQGRRSLLYRATRAVDGRPVILKMSSTAVSAKTVGLRLRHEFEVLQHLEGHGAIRAIEMLTGLEHPILVLEDLKGRSLGSWLSTHTLGVLEVLKLTRKLVTCLQRVHERRVIHKDLNPSNILVIEPSMSCAFPHELEVRLIDFGISATISRETPSFKNLTMVEGTLPYIAPEQTGRMNRSVDYRTDFYSLGICLYELLTGSVPFTTKDPLALIHCHLAQSPKPPHEQTPEVPEAVSALVMKLLAKDADDRYQSLQGLQTDITCCLEQLEETGRIEPFELGLNEQPLRLQIPQGLYGRKEEVQHLLAAFEHVCSALSPEGAQGKAELLLVAGESGVGKSSLAHELHAPITQRRGIFLVGKFEQYQGSTVPYSGFARAFDSFCHYLLTEREEVLRNWRERIVQAVGENGRVITEIIPSLESVIGPQAALPELDSQGRQSAFELTFRRFLAAICRPEHPLVLFLDDLQWADRASVALLKSLFNGSTMGDLLVIGAYRDNEVGPGHPLSLLMEDLRAQGNVLSTIKLGNLTVEHVNELVAHTLKCSLARAQELARLVHAKTRGNAFFVRQFLHSLYEARMLVCLPAAPREEQWFWDMTAVRGRSMTDNVIDLLKRKIKGLPEGTRAVLELAACIGSTFSLKTLVLVAHERLPVDHALLAGAGALLPVGRTVLRQLQPAIEEEFVVPSEQAYKVVKIQQPDASDLAQASFSFQHDRIHQAVYDGIPERERTALHLAVGRRLLELLPAERLEKHLFEIVDQYNHGIPLMTEKKERHRLAHLNLRAGTKAKAANAPGPAVQYLENGLSLLHAGSWQEDYELTRGLHVEMVEAAYLSGEHERMEHYAREALSHAHQLLDVIQVHEIKIQACQAQNRLAEAVNLGLSVLAELGISFPSPPETENLEAAFMAIRRLLGDRGAEEMAALPPMTDPHLLAAVRIMTSIISVVWNVSPALYPFTVLKFVDISVRHGNTASSGLFYSAYALIRCAAADDIEDAYRWAQIAKEVGRRFDTPRSRGRTLFTTNFFVWHWKHPIAETLPALRECYTFAMESGDLEQVAWSLIGQVCAWHCTRQPLPAMRAKIEEHLEILARIKQTRVSELACIYLQGVIQLSEEVERPWELVGDVYDERGKSEAYRADNNLMALAMLHCNRLVNAYLFGQYKRSLREDVQVLDACIVGAAATVVLPVLNLYDSLTRLALAGDMAEEERAASLARVEQNQQRLLHWARHAPMNHQHKYALVEAERARLRGDRWQAVEFYHVAIEGAREHGFVREEAVANERAGHFWETQHKPEYARMHLKRARQIYDTWGAQGKVAALTKQLSQGELPEPLAGSNSGVGSGRSSTVPTFNLDLLSIIRAARTISSEIVQAELLHTMLRIIQENAGAQYAALVDFREGAGWIIRGQSQMEQRAPGELPESVLNYVRRTLKPVVIDDASIQSPYADDAVVRSRGLHSVLCHPLIHRARQHGLLYLENSLSTHAFGEARQDIVEILASQAAVALDNAALYHHLTEQNRALETSRSTIAVAKQQLQALIDNSPAIIYMKDVEGRYLTVNTRFEELLGTWREDIVGKQDSELRLAAHANRFALNDHHARVRGATVNFEEELSLPDGVHTYLSSKFPLRTADNHIYAICSISTDITDRKHAERALQVANEELEQRVAERTEQLHAAQLQLVDRARSAGMFEIASSILHNLGNALNGLTVSNSWLRGHLQSLPIASLGKAIDLLNCPPGELVTFFTQDEKGRLLIRFLNELHQKLREEQELLLEECENMSSQLEHVQDVISTQQRYAKTRITLRERLRLRDLSEDAIRLCTIGGHFEKLIQREYGDEEPELYERHLIVQILIALITNAKKAIGAMPSDSNPCIRILIRQDANHTTLTVADNGVGFDERLKVKLFASGFTTRASGHGHGLHSAAVSVQSLGGKIEAHSDGPGHGARFQLVLPRNRNGAASEQGALEPGWA